jgi:hypothetical protein
LLRKFEHELNDRVTELQRKVVDESEEAALRDQDIIREKDDQMASFEQGTKRERQKTVEHQMVLEKAIREEHEARVAQAATLTKALDRVNHDVVALVEDERLARETKESKLRGQITQTLAKLHDANRDTNERLETEAHAVRSVVKAEIEGARHRYGCRAQGSGARNHRDGAPARRRPRGSRAGGAHGGGEAFPASRGHRGPR